MFYGIFNNRVIIIVFSIIWGFGITTLFRNACSDMLNKNCNVIKFVAPDPKEIEKYVFKYNGRCVKYYPILC
jgi:hypothetical protein